MRREQPCDVLLRKGRGRAQDQFSIPDGFGDFCGHQRKLQIVMAIGVLEDNARAHGPMRRYLSRIAPPQADVMALQRKIARGCEGTVAAAKHRDLQLASPCARGCSSSCLSMKCWTLPNAVRGRSSTKTISRGTLKRASCFSTCASKSCASTELPARLITKATGT